ncbi:MAG TPA: ATP-dependent helicase [Steroidobacteraceae bacterium]|nr:ATP-dependent helicase [Steroidobacteraceae bacterium]
MSATTFERLNAAQRLAAQFGSAPHTGAGWESGPLLIIAGAGTGKTNTLAHRVAWLVLCGVHPNRILLLTFTRRAAQEMIGRTRRILDASLRERANAGRAPEELRWAGTFHSIANRLLRQYARNLGLDPAFSVLDRGDSADLLDIARQELGLAAKEKRFPRKDTCLAIYSHRVNTQGELEQTLHEQYPWCLEWHDELRRLYREYVRRKQAEQLLDYDDLLLYWQVLMGDATLARAVGAAFDHVLVDEYQDTNTLQADILLRLKPHGAGVTVVGDDAQAIYSFRAATADNILGFPERFSPPAATVALEQNFRSTQPILDSANALIAESARQHRKELRAVRAGGEAPALVTAADLRQQAEYVAGRILANREAGMLLRRQAVLFRSSSDSDLLEIELSRRNIPFVKYGGLRFLEAAHVKDLLSILRWADNPRNTLAAFRVLQLLSGMGPANARRVIGQLGESGYHLASLRNLAVPAASADGFRMLGDLLFFLSDPTTPWPGQTQRAREWYEPELERLYDAAHVRAADLGQLEQLAMQYPSRERFLSELALDPPNATGNEVGPPLLDEDYLVLSTVHSAKGQEWDAVFVLNVTDGSFPSEFAGGKPAQIEEERRLLYVAMTRARAQLELVCPLRFHVTQQPRHGDAHVYGARSRFLTARVLGTLREITVAQSPLLDPELAAATMVIDAGARLRERW